MKYLKIHPSKIPSTKMGPPKILPPDLSVVLAGRKEGGTGPRLIPSPVPGAGRAISVPVPYLCLGIQHPVAC